MKVLHVQRWSGLCVLAALVVATHFVDRSSSHLRAELTLAALVAAAVVHASASLWVVGTDYAGRGRARVSWLVLSIALGAVGLGAAARSVASERRAPDTPGHFAGARCETCHATHPFRLDAHSTMTCETCHDVRGRRAWLSRFDAPLVTLMAEREACATCHRPPPAPIPSPAPSESATTRPAPLYELRPVAAGAPSGDLVNDDAWGRAPEVAIPRDGDAAPLEIASLVTPDRVALRLRAKVAEHGFLAVMGAVSAGPAFDKMGCATSCHEREKHRASAPTERFRAFVIFASDARVLDVDARGMRPSNARARVERAGDFVVLSFDRSLVDLDRGLSIALSDGGESHALRPRPLRVVLAP